MFLKLIQAIREFFGNKKNSKKEEAKQNNNIIAWSLENSAIRNFDIQKLYNEINLH